MSLKLNSSGGGSVTLQEPNTASARVLDLPDANGTIVSTGATAVITNAMLAASAIAQVASATSSTTTTITNANAIPVDGTPPLSTEGTQILTLSITPRSTSSKIVLLSNIPVFQSTASSANAHTVALFRGTTLLSVRGAGSGGYFLSLYNEHTFVVVDSPNSSTAVTYSLRAGPGTSQNSMEVNPSGQYGNNWGTYLAAVEVLI